MNYLYSLYIMEELERGVGDVILVQLPKNKTAQYRWITRKRDDGKLMARTPKQKITTADQLFAAKTAIGINRGAESDYGPEQILPIGSKRIITQYEKNEKLFFYMNLGELDKVIEALNEGADVNSTEQNYSPHNADMGDAPIHVAVLDQNLEMTELLLRKGADPNAMNKEKMTPLHYVADSRFPNIIELATTLLNHGADIHIEGKHGKTPLDLFESRFKKRIKKLAVDKEREIQYKKRQENELRKLSNSRVMNTKKASNGTLLPSEVLSRIAEFGDDLKNERTLETVANVESGLDDRKQREGSKFGGKQKTKKRKNQIRKTRKQK